MTWEIRQISINRLAREEGAIIKDWGGRLPIALVYPNSYYVGMSSLGFQTLYGLINQYSDFVCERVFAAERGLKTEGRSEWSAGEKRRAKLSSNSSDGYTPLSVESQRQLDEFPVIAFSISFELDYFNVINILKSAGIPPLASERGDDHPLLIAGGASVTANPEPLSEIFDCFVLGEAEPILPQLLSALRDGVAEKKDVLKSELSRIPGVYVPCLHPVDKDGGKHRVSRQWAPNIDDFATCSSIFTPDTELSDMYLMEIARGCSRGCRFCLAGFAYRPVRLRSVDKLLQQAEEGLKHRDRIGLVSAAVSDYPGIDDLVSGLQKLGARIAVSSLRIHPFSELLLDALVESGTRTITLAPEAGSERLRKVIQKGITEDQILSSVDLTAKKGIRKLKLYFMLGLPTETEDDIRALVELVLSCKARLDMRSRGTGITVNLTPFVPKAGTPFQWESMAEAKTLKNRLQFIKNCLRFKGIEVRSESIDWSIAQAILARGDKALSKVLTDMDSFSATGFRKAMESHGLDYSWYAHQTRSHDETLPWSFIDSGTSIEMLEREHERAVGLNVPG